MIPPLPPCLKCFIVKNQEMIWKGGDRDRVLACLLYSYFLVLQCKTTRFIKTLFFFTFEGWKEQIKLVYNFNPDFFYIKSLHFSCTGYKECQNMKNTFFILSNMSSLTFEIIAFYALNMNLIRLECLQKLLLNVCLLYFQRKRIYNFVIML